MLLKHMLLDLDGTLTDPKIGINRSIAFALTQLKANVPNDHRLTACIGPPLSESFAQLLPQPTAEKINEAIAQYRTRFTAVGIYENKVYDSIPTALAQLKSQGIALHLATSKPRVFAERILDHFALSGHFTTVYGSELDGTRSQKAALIAYILKQESILPEQAVMVGDRSHDVVGAIANHVLPIGVLWGFGSKTELKQAGAAHLLTSPSDLSSVPVRLLS